MQDDFNSATTAPGLPTPPPAPPRQPQPSQRPAQAASPAQPPQQWLQGQTVPYDGPVDTDPPTSNLPPTIYHPAPSGPPVYVPPGFNPPAPTRLPPPSGRPPALPAPVRQPQPSGRPPLPPGQPRPPSRSGRPGGPGGSGGSAQPPRRGAWVPLSHALLLIGVALLYVATLLPWAVSSSGTLIMLQTASIPGAAGQGAGSALQMADDLVGAIGVLSAGLLFFNVILSGLNRLLGGGCLGGCLVAPLYPILMALIGLLAIAITLAAGFGGIGALGDLPVVQSYGLGGIGVAHYEPGYYAWYTGLMVNVAGMLGEFVVWRR